MATRDIHCADLSTALLNSREDKFKKNLNCWYVHICVQKKYINELKWYALRHK